MSQTKTRITCVSRVSLATIAPDPLLNLVKYDDTLGDLQSLYISTGDNREFFPRDILDRGDSFMEEADERVIPCPAVVVERLS